MGKLDKPVEAVALPGPKSLFRGKVRTRPSVVLTPKGHETLQADLDRTGASRSDYIEGLIHENAGKMTRERLKEIADDVNEQNRATA